MVEHSTSQGVRIKTSTAKNIKQIFCCVFVADVVFVVFIVRAVNVILIPHYSPDAAKR